MCQTAVLSKNIARVSTRGYLQNVEALAGEPLRIHKLNRLNSSLDDLYHLLWEQFNSITKEDYLLIGPQLNLLLTTIKDLYKTCKRLGDSTEMKQQASRLAHNYSALYEIDNDLRQYRMRKQSKELTKSLEKAGSILLTH